MKKLIFIVEDEENIQELYECALNSNYETFVFENGVEMFEALKRRIPDLFILDIMLPGLSGGNILEQIKKDSRYADIPVIMVSAKSDEISKVKHLDKGADDYITKPFGILELTARINANLRKRVSNAKIEGVELNEALFGINIDGINYKTTVKEFELIKFLMENFNKVCKRDEILNKVWGIEFDCESRTIDMHIKTIREKLSGSKLEIETIRGVGYILKRKDES
jgi:two-component system alkaline phosphatase synthesis response regulator PhoP